MVWTSPRTWVAGESPSAATMNLHIRDNLKAIGDAWTAFTPTMTAWTHGNGTLASHYMEAGKLVHFRIKLTLGTTSTMVGSPTFTLPVNATAAHTVGAKVEMFDTSAASATAYKAGSAFNSGVGTILLRDDASAVLSATSPFTWATGDILTITGSYEGT
jgi:hypothetical protein